MPTRLIGVVILASVSLGYAQPAPQTAPPPQSDPTAQIQKAAQDSSAAAREIQGAAQKVQDATTSIQNAATTVTSTAAKTDAAATKAAAELTGAAGKATTAADEVTQAAQTAKKQIEDAAAAMNEAAKQAESAAKRLEKDAKRFGLASLNKNDRGYFTLSPQAPAPGKRVVAELRCADSISRAECLLLAGKARLEVKRKGAGQAPECATGTSKSAAGCCPPDTWCAEWQPARLSYGSPSGCGEAPAQPAGNGAHHHDALLTFCLAQPLDSGDQVRIRQSLRTWSRVEICSDPTAKAATHAAARAPLPGEFPVGDGPPADETDAEDDQAQAPAWPPAVAIDQPKDGATILDDTTLVANAPAGVVQLTFMIGDERHPAAGSGPTFTYRWVTGSLEDGKTYTIKTIATNAAGFERPGPAVNVTFRKAASLTLTGVTKGQVVSGLVELTSEMPAGSPVKQVSFMADKDVLATVKADGLKFLYRWPSAPTDNGKRTLKAVGLDAAGNPVQNAQGKPIESPEISVIVENPPPVPITSPAGGAVITGPFHVTAAPATAAVASVTFVLDGQPLSDPVKATGSTFEYTWDPSATGTANGLHRLRTVARDSQGFGTPSAEIQVTVQIATTDLKPKMTPNGATGVTISWSTDKASTSEISYGLASTDEKSSIDKSAVTSHSVALTGLTPWTPYRIKVASKDAQGAVVASSKELQYATPAVVITAPTAGSSIGGTFKFTATGTEKAGATVQFLLNGDMKLVPAVTASGGAFTLAVDTTKIPNGDYSLTAQVSVGDKPTCITPPINITISNPPVVTAPTVEQITTAGAVIKWNTNRPSDSRVSFGETTDFGHQKLHDDSTVGDRWSEHSITLSGLTPSTKYHYKVESADAQGNTGASSGDLTFTTLPTAPDVVTQLTEGTSKVNGRYNSGKADKVRVTVTDGNTGTEVQEVQEQAVKADHTFSVPLDLPLSSEAQVQIAGVNGEDKQSSDTVKASVAPSVFDWGRVRAYFTFGMLISSAETVTSSGATTNNAFSTSSASPFLSFNLDKNWLLRREGFGQHFRFNSFFDARLTQIGTAAAASTTTPAGGSTNLTSILANKQAGSLQGGFYAPIILTRFYARGDANSLYVAPMAKAGFYTTNDAAAVGGATILSRTNFYKFYAYGVRVGHYREYRYWNGNMHTGKAPEQLSYLDFLVGRWANYEYVAPYDSVYCDTVSDPSKAVCFVRQRLWRYAFEGILKIPHTPFIIGVSANVAAQHLKEGKHAADFLTPPDDLRFLFGLRFDAKTLLAPLTKLGGITP